MTAKTKQMLRYECNVCGRKVPSFSAQCPKCLHWDTFRACKPVKPPQSPGAAVVSSTDPVKGYAVRRLATGMKDVDAVLCGGFVKGRSHVLAGDPGAGKSTLSLQLARGVAGADRKILYVCGEEGVGAVQHRAQRIGAQHKCVLLTPVVELDALKGVITDVNPAMVVFDSVQMLYDPSLRGEPGDVAQIRRTVKVLALWCNARNLVSVFLSHVNKQGRIGGPQFFRHMTDVTLELGLDENDVRELRCRKNRDGGTDRTARMVMTPKGLKSQER